MTRRTGALSVPAGVAPLAVAGGVRRAAVVLAIGLVASALTIFFGSFIRNTGFVFFYGAVVASAIYARVLGGLFATALGILVVAYRLLPPADSLKLSDPADVVAVIAFGAVSLAVIALAEWLHRQAAQLARARDMAVASEERSRLVDEASRVLASSLDYQTTVATVARLAVPDFADWCIVHLVVDGEIKPLAVAHADPEKVRWVQDIETRYRPEPDLATGVPGVIRTSQPVLAREVTDGMLMDAARDAEHLAILRKVGVHSVMIVPMVARETTIGALTLISSRPQRRFDEADLAIAQDLGRRAAVAIDNARLYQVAVAANEAKANFLATMSHELRTPLTAIIGYEELLADGISGPVSEEQRKQLRRIKASATRLLSMIDEILLYARVEAGRESVHSERVVVKGAVDEALAFMSSAASERGLTLEAESIDPALTLYTDAGKLRQMLISLLSNAVKFTTKGGVVVRAFERDAHLVFEIRDTGIGIDREDLEHVFDPFWQVQQTTTRTIGGSGLGLTVTRRLAQLLGGDITVESTLFAGSTFRITLPKTPASPGGSRTA